MRTGAGDPRDRVDLVVSERDQGAHRDRAHLDQRVERLNGLRGVTGLHDDRIAGPQPRLDQPAGDSVRTGVEFREGEPPLVGDQRVDVGMRGGDGPELITDRLAAPVASGAVAPHELGWVRDEPAVMKHVSLPFAAIR